MRIALDQFRNAMNKEAPAGTVSKWSLRPEVLLLLSTIIYFLPLAVGWWVYVTPRGNSVVLDYHSAVIPAVVMALGSILAAVAILPARTVNVRSAVLTAATQREGLIICGLIVLSGIYVVFTPGLFSPVKADVLRASGRGHYLFYNLCALGFLHCALVGWQRNPWLLALSVIGILLTLYIGHRSTAALAIAGALYIAYRDRSLFSIGLKRGIAVLAAIVVLMLYKLISTKIKRGDFGAAIDRISDGPFSGNAVFGMEPFVTFAHLDFVVANDFHLGCTNLWYVPLSIVPFANEIFDQAACDYNQQVQPVFFSGYDSGVGANIWAEFFANFGYAGIPLLVVMVVALGRCLEFVLVRVQSVVLRAGIIFGIVQLTVYIQRNEFLGAFVLAKRAVLVAVVVAALAWLFSPIQLAKLRRQLASRW